MSINELVVPKTPFSTYRNSRSPFISNQSPIPDNTYDKPARLSLNKSGSLSKLGGSIVSSPSPRPQDINSVTIRKPYLNTSQSVKTLDNITILDTFQSNQLPPIHESNLSGQTRKGVPTHRTIFLDKRASPLLNVGYGGVEKPHFDLNPLYTSTHYRDRQVAPIAPPREKIRAIFAIYYLGRGFNAVTNTFGRPNGLGILLSPDLCLTTHSVLPDEESAKNSYAQFRDSEVFKFDPKRCFVTSSNHEFTLVAFQSQSANSLQYFKPIHITEPLSLHIEDAVAFFPYDAHANKKVVAIEKNYFTFTSGKKEDLLPGTAVFSSTWVFQGMYIRSSSHINVANRMEHILAYLESILSIYPNSLLEQFLHLDHMGFLEQFHDRYLYYFEWHGRNTWRYDIDLGEWAHVTLRGLENLESTHKNWTYNWNSRLVYLPDMSILIIGGKSKQTGAETNEVWLFSPAKYNTLKKISSLITARESCAVVYIENYVYVFGGKPYLQSCERLSLASQRWTEITPMYYARYEATACPALDSTHIFVFGGGPMNPTGNTIESYSIKQNQWQLLPITMPRPLVKLAVFPITNRKIAILGGHGSNWVYLMYIEDLLDQQGYTYKIEDCMKPLDEILETVWPVAYCRRNNKLYMLNLNRSGYTGVTPGVVEYPLEYFDMGQELDRDVDIFSTSKPGRVQTPISLQRLM